MYHNKTIITIRYVLTKTKFYSETSFVIWQLEQIKMFYLYKSSRIEKE